MAYNTGNFSLFNQTANFTNVFVDAKNPVFRPPVTFFYATIYGQSIAPTITTSGTGTVGTAYGQQIGSFINSSTTVSAAYGMSLSGSAVNAGTLTNAYTVYVTPPSFTAGTIVNNYTAYFGLPSTGTIQGGVGIGTTTPRNALDVNGGVAIGSYAGVLTAGYGNLIISGTATTTPAVGVNNSSPQYLLDVGGTLNASAAYGWMPQGRNQLISLAEGNNQGGIGGGSVGTMKTMSANTTLSFDTGSLVNTASRGFWGSLFDGRYVYFVPNQSGQITRYDTTQFFSASAAYAVFNTAANVNSNSLSFKGGAFDGRYLYFAPTNSQITRFDTNLPFTAASSYAVYNISSIQGASVSFEGAVFDGRYVYYIPDGVNALGQVTQYDTTLSFTSAGSYAVFSISTNVSSNSVGFYGGTFDGRYVYFAPNNNNLTYSGQIVQYDTSLPFGTATSYATFNSTALSGNSLGFWGAVFDGRFVYFVPSFIPITTYSGQVTRYDTTGSFVSSSSYAVFDMSTVNSANVGFAGSVFDGRYVYYIPNNNGQISRYDTTQSFQNSTSYTFFNTASVTSYSAGFIGAIFDGRYVYLSPNKNSATYSGLIARIDGYPGPNASAIAASNFPSSFAIGAYAGVTAPPTNGLIVSGNVGIGTSSPQYLLDIGTGTLSAQYFYGLMPQQPNQTISLAEGYNQGGFGGGSVGTNKTMSANTSVNFICSNLINSNATGFYGAVFDGRYVYYVPFTTPQILRYDTNQPYSASASYATFNVSTLISFSGNAFEGAIFDGRYIYYLPASGLVVTRYDTTFPFQLTTSYAVFNIGSINGTPVDFYGAVFDGRYVYYVPQLSGVLTQYDTTANFLSSGSYSFFDMTTVQSNSKNFQGGTFDGRYVYLAPRSSGQPGQITRYDTTLPFGTSTSYALFDTQSVNTNSQKFGLALFDGRFVYFAPNNTTNTVVTRYDTTGAFTSSSSYAFFDMSLLNSNSAGCTGASFDGRYVYFAVGYNLAGSGAITRYDTTQLYTNTPSWVYFIVPGNDAWTGSVFDGRYIHLASNTVAGINTRIDAYPGPLANAIAASGAPNGFSIGAYAGTPPSTPNNLIVSGSVGAGVSSPSYLLDVTGGQIGAQYIYGVMPQQPNQTITLAEGYGQGGFGGSSVGTNKTLSANTIVSFDASTISSSGGISYGGAGFDGRYVYYSPAFIANTTTSDPIILRFDTTQPYSQASSYSTFNTTSVAGSTSYGGVVFDGRYMYFLPYTLHGNNAILQYDTTLPFQLASSYAYTTNYNQLNYGIFDGRYLYFLSGTYGGGVVVQYDTTTSFSTGTFVSYTLPISGGYGSGTFDGRYVYFPPYGNNTPSGLITRYDTTLPFGTASSFTSFDASTINGNALSYTSSTFDGRYIYFTTGNNSGSYYIGGGYIVRYDTLGGFSSSSSYAFLAGSTINSGIATFICSLFDGRYVYFTGNNYSVGWVVSYDTTQSFSNLSSYVYYQLYNLGAGSTSGLVFDGRYLYLPTYFYNSVINRIDAYPGYAASVLATNNLNPNGFSIGAYAGTTTVTSGLLVSGLVGIGTTSPNYLVDVTGAASAQYVYGLVPQAPNQTISLAEGYNQGGFGSGSVGTNKTMSSNTTLSYDVSAVAGSVCYSGVVFDGRYVYYSPTNLTGNNSSYSSQILRFDTTLQFAQGTSYATFNAVSLVGTAGFSTGAYDGRYVYFLPTTFSNPSILRYDTTLPFELSTSYAAYALGKGYVYSVFDGRYLYYFQGTFSSSQVAQYDTTASFTSASSYVTYTLPASSYGGGTFDGRYVYFAPYGANTPSGVITRYDTTLPFGTATSFSSFNVTNVYGSAYSFTSAVFDGRYIYFTQGNVYGDEWLGGALITRYDTFASFFASTSYAFYNGALVNSIISTFLCSCFDGRYVYFIGMNNSSNQYVVSYDTTQSFSNSTSFAYQVISADPPNSCVFDGRYIYIAPNFYNTIVIRLDAYPGQLAASLATSGLNPAGFSVGTYAGTTTLSGGILVGGQLGIGNPNPNYAVDIYGSVNAQQAIGLMPQGDNQRILLAEGYNQGGFGGGSVGTQKTMSANATLYFDTSVNVNSNSVGFSAGIFDGRYIYFVPYTNTITYSGQITRYDTTFPFATSASYAVFDTQANVNSNSVGFYGGVFDGRYVYLVPNTNTITYSGQITRYDTTLSFVSATSYSVFDTKANVNSNSVGFAGGIFDGRYVYLIPYFNGVTYVGQITRYDTTLSFVSATSYSVFDTKTNVNSNSVGFYGGVFDGQYVYLVPNINNFNTSGQITRYNTTLPFSVSTSYAVFDTAANVNTNSSGFACGVFDGRYIYLVPLNNGAFFGQITRYDTTLSFKTSASYAVFDTKTYVNSNSAGFFGGVFDGRYVYFVPSNNGVGIFGQITRYDTTLPFTVSSSYMVFNTSAANTVSAGFNGGVFDGRYVYLIPFRNTSTYFGQITRIDGYPGPQATAIAASGAPNGFVVGSAYVGNYVPTASGLIVSSAVGIGTSAPSYSLDVAGAVYSQAIYGYMPQAQNQLVNLSEKVSGYCSGSVGTNKTMSQNTTVYSSLATETNNMVFQGAVFDGRYIYFVPNYNYSISSFSGLITRYDTTQSFSLSASYAFFNSTSLQSNSQGFIGGAFDGRYVYFVPSFNISVQAQITRYDTTLPFGVSSSYSFHSMAAVDFSGAVFDGRYLYFVPALNATVAQYDTSQSFSASASYNYFNMVTGVNSNTAQFSGGVYDGRYVYYVPYKNGFASFSGQLVQYDTTLPFGSASSYSLFNTVVLNSSCVGYRGGVFDGRYVYLVPTLTFSSQLTRYDTTLPFGSSNSYTFLNTVNVNSNSGGFFYGVFDGRYVYLIPNANGQITQYDTTLPFSLTTSYTIFNTAIGSASSANFNGGIYDGRYVYLYPNQNNIVTRIDAYPGPAASGLLASTQASNNFTLGTGVTNIPTATTASSGSGQAVPGTLAGFVILNINGTPQKIPYYN